MAMIYYMVKEVQKMMVSIKRLNIWHQSINTSLLLRQESQRVLS
jgi:hypothetical protein